MRSGRHTPCDHSDQQSRSYPYLIEPSTGQNIPYCVSRLKCRDHPTVINLSPTKVRVQHRLQDAENCTVQIIDRSSQKEQCNYGPVHDVGGGR